MGPWSVCQPRFQGSPKYRRSIPRTAIFSAAADHGSARYHYGERAGRHLVGCGAVFGYARVRVFLRNTIFERRLLTRDYVIDSFNADNLFDQSFVSNWRCAFDRDVPHGVARCLVSSRRPRFKNDDHEDHADRHRRGLNTRTDGLTIALCPFGHDPTIRSDHDR